MNVDVRIAYLESELEEAQTETIRWRRVAVAAVVVCACLVALLVNGSGV